MAMIFLDLDGDSTGISQLEKFYRYIYREREISVSNGKISTTTRPTLPKFFSVSMTSLG
jgi:hypothetical protein